MTGPAKDLLARPGTTILVYCVPTLAIVATEALGAVGALQTLIWTLGFTVMGLACVLNAMRCGRVHCYFTGPFLLLLAAASLLHGFGIVSLGPKGWQWLGLVAIVGTVLFLTVPERLWGRYANRAKREDGSRQPPAAL